MTNSPRKRFSPLGQLILTRVREFYREPAAVFWVYVFPILITFTLGLAFRAETKQTHNLSIVQSSRSAQIAEQLTSDPESRFVVSETSFDDARRLLRTGKTELVLIPEEIAAGDSEFSVAKGYSLDSLTYWFDPRNQNSDLARMAIDDFLQRTQGRQDVFESKTRIMDEPGGRYIDFLIPGLICMNLMGSGLWGVGFAIVDLRIRGLLKRLVATPMRRIDFLLATMTSRMFFLIPEILIVFLFAWIVFDVQIYGNLWLVVGLILLGSFQFAGIGLLVASRAKTIETVSGLMNLLMLPNWIFAGIFFSSSKFPDFMQWFVQALPLTSLVDALRAVMLENHGVLDIFPQLIGIVLWTVTSFALALRIFRWN
ncbi:MAG: ABC transporter permease [Planctomycetota bacterium]|nr:ABC transporter permease [Planctomycetota bacterium]